MVPDSRVSAPTILAEVERESFAAVIPGAIVFDLATGLPVTLAAARTMSAAAIRAALGKTLATLPGRTPSTPLTGGAVGGSPGSLESLEVIWLLSKFDRLFDKPLLDLTKIPNPQWSTLDAVADLLDDAIRNRP